MCTDSVPVITGERDDDMLKEALFGIDTEDNDAKITRSKATALAGDCMGISALFSC